MSWDWDDHQWSGDRKAGKQARKLASSKDRSKYKKTDRDKSLKQEKEDRTRKSEESDYSRGRVLSILSKGIIVEEGDNGNNLYTCSLRGALKKETSQFKNLVTVGDFVLFEKHGPDEGVICQVEERKSFLSRADNLSRRKEQLIAANIDQVLITVAVVSPPLKSAIVDRYIIAALKGKMQPIIVINKIDLLHDPEVDEIAREVESEYYEEFLSAYKGVGITVLGVSVQTGAGLDKLKALMHDKASVFSGPSGVGKTSLINAIMGTNMRIGKVVERTQKGAHTTTTTQLLPLEFGGWCIDTPGIKSFGVWDLKKEEIVEYFDEIFALGRNCRYPDCTHMQEEQCAVLNAVEEGQISPLRYQSYLALMDSASTEHKRR